MKNIICFIFAIFLLAGVFAPVYGAGTSGSISNVYLYDYSQPPSFQPSLSGQFTSLANGATTVMANPAGIMKVNTLEAAMGLSGLMKNPIKNDNNVFYVDDQDMTQDLPGTAKAGIGIRFTADMSVSTPEPRAISLTDTYSKGGGINYFGLTFRISDNLAVAFSRQRPSALTINTSAYFPEMNDITLDMRGFEQLDSGDGFRIRDDGRIEGIAGGIVTTSDAAVYSGFLDQSTKEVNWVKIKVNNTVVNQQSVIVSTGLKTGPIDWGINIIPITYNINIDNNIALSGDQNNGNMKFLVPNILDNPSSFEIFYWATAEATVEAGYVSREIMTHPSSTLELAEIVVAGQYTGSALRMDLGAMWEPNDFFSAGFMFENFNGAQMVLSGTNVVHYARHYISMESAMPTQETLWDPFLSSPTHETEAEKYIMLGDTLPPIVLPSKLKFGFALKKPIILALDWEQWQSEVGINTNPGSPEGAAIAHLSNLTFLKVGSETQILFFPVLLRGSLTMLMKPSTDDPVLQQSFDDLFASIPILPVEGDIYFCGKILSGELGFGFGGGGLPLTMAMAADMSKIAKIFFVDVYYAEQFWKIDYQMTTDPILSGFESDFAKGSASLATTSTLSIGIKF